MDIAPLDDDTPRHSKSDRIPGQGGESSQRSPSNVPGAEPVRVGVASPTQQSAALALALRSSPDLRKVLQQDSAALDCLRVAHQGDRLLAAVIAQPLGGRAACLWPVAFAKALDGAECEDLAGRLYEALHQVLARQGIELAQTLLTAGQRREAELLRRSGYLLAAELDYLVSDRADFPDSEPNTTLQFEPFAPSALPRLQAVVEATYRDTRDCPILNDLRTTEDVVAGYRNHEHFRPTDWFLVREAGKDAGCVLLQHHPEANHFELVYMGVIPEYRGRGYGIEIVRFAQWHCRRRGGEKLVLAVDTENEPAICAYATAGFRALTERRVWLRKLGPA